MINWLIKASNDPDILDNLFLYGEFLALLVVFCAVSYFVGDGK